MNIFKEMELLDDMNMSDNEDEIDSEENEENNKMDEELNNNNRKNIKIK